MTRIVRTTYRYKRRLVIAGICGLIGLAVAHAALGAENKFDGVYTGKRLLTQGSEACPIEEDVSATIHGEVLTISTSRLRDVPMGFYPQPDGSFSETSTGIGGYVATIQGRIVGNILEADVADRDCDYYWRMTRKGLP
jgi:hypothetical protein